MLLAGATIPIVSPRLSAGGLRLAFAVPLPNRMLSSLRLLAPGPSRLSLIAAESRPGRLSRRARVAKPRDPSARFAHLPTLVLE